MRSGDDFFGNGGGELGRLIVERRRETIEVSERILRPIEVYWSCHRRNRRVPHVRSHRTTRACGTVDRPASIAFQRRSSSAISSDLRMIGSGVEDGEPRPSTRPRETHLRCRCSQSLCGGAFSRADLAACHYCAHASVTATRRYMNARATSLAESMRKAREHRATHGEYRDAQFSQGGQGIPVSELETLPIVSREGCSRWAARPEMQKQA